MTKVAFMNVHGGEEFYVEFVPDRNDAETTDRSSTGHSVRSSIPAFSSTVQKTKRWITELMEQLQWQDAQKAYHGMRAVLHTLRDRLTIAEATDLAAQLPMLIRGMYYEGWQPGRTPVRDRSYEAFLTHIFRAFPDDPSVDPERLVHAVIHVLKKHVSKGELDDIQAVLPNRLRTLFDDD